MPQPGELIHGKYRILQQLADGGMGTIYEARHEVLGTTVALKMLHPNLAKRPNLAARFLQEARVSATLRSPHIVQVLDVEQGPQGAILVMELLRGETLQVTLDRQRRLEVPVAIDYALQMLEGLEIAHAANVVHRDLKPDNVFLVPGAQGPLLKLLDFGIAKLRTSPEFDRGLTRPGVVMGTPEYMAPEQAFSADTVDARADIYALGVIVFEMLSGQRPVRGDDPKDIAQKIFSGRVTALSALLPSLPMGLVSAVHRAMAPTPQGRFSSAAEMRQALAPFGAPRGDRGSTSVLGPLSLPTLPAPTQPTPGSLPPHPGGAPTPPLPASVQPSGSFPGQGTGSLPGGSFPGQTSPLPGHATGSFSASVAALATGTPAGGQPPTGPGLTPSPILTPAPAPVPTGSMSGWPADRPPGGVPQTLPPEAKNPAGGMTTARDPLPQALTGAQPAAPAWAPPAFAATAPASPLPAHAVPPTVPPQAGHPTALPDAYGATAYGSANGPGGTALQSVYTGGSEPSSAATPGAYYAPPPRPSRKGPPVGLIAVLAALAGGLAVVLILALQGNRDQGSSTPTPTYTAPTTPSASPTVTALPTTTLPPFPTSLPTQPGAHPGTPGNPGTPGKPAPRDGGVEDGGADGGRGPLGLPMPGIPSGLPSIPSGLPSIPSGIPTQIQIPIPGIPGFP